ncbi:MAG TPA: TIM44-like domain-containing protein [Solirubrobacteraceae bacterium]|nr:TIM44-like domain-containing protein [Solirubrobacteraceae bacterium]
MSPKRSRRAALALLFAIGIVLILAPAAFAAAGGGSSNFGGGGGGGGGVGHGKGFAIYLIFRAILDLILFTHGIARVLVIAVIAAVVVYAAFGRRIRAWWQNRPRSGRADRRRVAQRQRKVELAAAEAAEDDPAFAPEAVRTEAARLFTQIQSAWDAGNRIRLRALVAPELLTEWERRLDDFARRGWRNHVKPLGEPKVEYVGLTRRGGNEPDRVVVRIEAKLRDYVEDQYGNHIKRAGRLSETTRVREFWTLGRRGSHWVLASIEQGAEGAHALAETVAPTPWSDERALQDQALVEGAVADAIPEGTSVSEVADVDYQGDARAAALDLSLADGRFAPAVLEVAARRAAAAWAEAVDGNDRALLAVARTDAAYALLHPQGGRTRLVVRGPEVRQIRIVGLDAASTPPTMTIEVELSGRRYLEDRDTAAVMSGSQTRVVKFTEHWTLALEGSDEQPWQIAQVGAPPAVTA